MAKVRTFRWPSGGGFDVVDGNVYYFEDGERGRLTNMWSLEELERYANDPGDSLQEVKKLAEVHTTRVLLVNGEVTDIEAAKALRDSLQQAIAEFEGEDKKVHTPVDFEARNSTNAPDFPGQVVVTHTWTAGNEGDGWVRVAVSAGKGEPQERTYLKIQEHLLSLIRDVHGEDNVGW